MRAATSDWSPKVALARARVREIDRESIDQGLLNVADRSRTNALPWRGQFTPGLPRLLIEQHCPKGLVLDPFVGSGTTLGEAARLGLASVGAEVNPAALHLARVYEFASLAPAEREVILVSGRKILAEAALLDDGIFGEEGNSALNTVAARCRGGNIEDPLEALLAATVLLALGNGREATAAHLMKAWAQVQGLVDSLPNLAVNATVLPADARYLPLPDDSVSMVLTSPPYVNVFNYHQNYRPAVELLGWDVLPAARSEIGSNRKNRANRLLTVIQYAIDMRLVLQEMVRVAHLDAPIVTIIGRESKVRGVSIPNGELVLALVDSLCGLRFENWQERHFTSRYGEVVYEEILTFRRIASDPELEADGGRIAAALAVEILSERLKDGSVTDDVRADLEAAIVGASAVTESPPLTLKRAEVN